MADRETNNRAQKPVDPAVKLLILILGGGFLAFLLPYFVNFIGIEASFGPSASWVLAIAASGIVLAYFLNLFVSDEVAVDKFGFELCVLTIGTALSGLTLQVISETSILSGIPPDFLGNAIARTEGGKITPVVRTIAFYIAILLMSVSFSLWTAKNCYWIATGRTQKIGFFSGLNLAIGLVALFTHFMILIWSI